ncbi:hypothetical protein BDN71DRAFT_1458651 [Pleurotus eryngii]|uniref:Uncharacterized protein n=1 Tax=Pleurotus eryngii TaxID=5323 RepID=A0A9P6D074_PLEER|nr:hypothetical protein BDN71DRAFT_1458651 [Pleurotus eryngii]
MPVALALGPTANPLSASHASQRRRGTGKRARTSTESWSLSLSVTLIVRVVIENAAEESRGQAVLASLYVSQRLERTLASVTEPAALLSLVVTHGSDTERKTTEGEVAPFRTRTNSTWSIELCSVPLPDSDFNLKRTRTM